MTLLCSLWHCHLEKEGEGGREGGAKGRRKEGREGGRERADKKGREQARKGGRDPGKYVGIISTMRSSTIEKVLKTTNFCTGNMRVLL